MITIIFESHGTTLDNEAHLSSGSYDVALSALGERQARELGERHKREYFDAVFCSDLQRFCKTAEIAFDDRGFPIIKDGRLRECDYGDWTRLASRQIDGVKGDYITRTFPNGESYEQTAIRMKKFLKDLLDMYDGKTVMLIGHRATQYGLEHWINKVPLQEAVLAPWQWQPGWTYYLTRV